MSEPSEGLSDGQLKTVPPRSERQSLQEDFDAEVTNTGLQSLPAKELRSPEDHRLTFDSDYPPFDVEGYLFAPKTRQLGAQAGQRSIVLIDIQETCVTYRDDTRRRMRVLRPQTEHGTRGPSHPQVLIDDAADVSNPHEPTRVEERAARAQSPHSAHVVADEDDGPPRGRDPLHLSQAFVLELRVSHGKNLVHDQDLGIQRSGDRKGEPYVHAAR